MFKNIRSALIYKNIFSYIRDKKTLKIINHNKTLQNKINIDFNLYMIYSGKYVEYLGEGIVRIFDAYNNNDIIYEGEYSDGKKNGKGKEYVFNKLKYEGEFLKGKRNGKGKEYDDDDNLEFSGEYLNGKKWNGKGYDKKLKRRKRICKRIWL